jgi:hypothetical protein
MIKIIVIMILLFMAIHWKLTLLTMVWFYYFGG